MLDQDKREELADIYSQIQQGNRKWRIRQIIAGQIGLLSKLFLEETIVKIIIPISFQLCKDDVASVREAACEQISALLQHNKGRPLCELLITENIKSFASYNRFTLRQSFVLMCDGLLEDLPFFHANFFALFEKLADDKVTNVRIGLAKVLARHFDRKSSATKDEAILRVYKRLSKDAAGDVVKVLRKEHTIIDEVISSSSDKHNSSKTVSEDFHSEDHKHDEDDVLEKIEQAKAHASPDKDHADDKILEPANDELPPKSVQHEIEKIVETKMVEETEIVKQPTDEVKVDEETAGNTAAVTATGDASLEQPVENNTADKDSEKDAEEVVTATLTATHPESETIDPTPTEDLKQDSQHVDGDSKTTDDWTVLPQETPAEQSAEI